MKKLVLLVLISGVYLVLPISLHAGPFDGLSKIASQMALSSWFNKTAPRAKLQTPPDMLPLSEYLTIPKIYTTDTPITDLEQQLASGVRHFIFELELTEQSRYLGLSKKTVLTAGKNKLVVNQVLDTLNAILHKKAYKNEVVLITLNNTANKIKYIDYNSLTKYAYSRSGNENPLIVDLRTKNRRIIISVDSFTNKPPFWDKNDSRLLNKNLYTVNDIVTINEQHNLAIGWDHFPKTSRSLFTPNFSMYQYIGMDYTTRSNPASTASSGTQVRAINQPSLENQLLRELAYGARGFRIPVEKNQTGEFFVKASNTHLYDAINPIIRFAKDHNEIIIIHLTNTQNIPAQELDDAITRITSNSSMIITENSTNKVIFKPEDRLADLKTTPLYGQIVKRYASKETGAGVKKIWPRISWNYAHQKLVQITYEGNQDTKNLWAYDHYYQDNTIRHDTTQLFYSDVLKSEQKFAVTVAGASAFALACLIVAQHLTSIASYKAFFESKAYELWGRVSMQAALAQTQEQKNELELTLIGSAVGILGITAAIAQTAIQMGKDLGLYAISKTDKTFTAVREAAITIEPIVYLPTPLSINRETQDNFQKTGKRNFDNFVQIDKMQMGWALRIAHTIRTLTRTNR